MKSVRNAAATRERIVQAAITEFSRHGLAGARIDRIAESADSNKALIYEYIGNKDDLFDVVFETLVVQTVDTIPIDGGDLPGYAARLFDAHIADPAPLRIGRWDELERHGKGTRSPVIVKAMAKKVAAVEAAQRSGQVDNSLPAAITLDLVFALSRSGPIGADPQATAQAIVAHRTAVIAAVTQIVDPGRRPPSPAIGPTPAPPFRRPC